MDRRYNNGRNFPKDFPFHEKPEEDDFIHIPNERSSSGGKKPIIVIAVLILIAGAGYGLFKTFYEIGHSISAPDGGTIPVIAASEEPFKELPENPGGLNIPHLDKQIYNKLDKELGSTIDQSEDELLPLPNRDDLMAQLVEEEDKKQQIKRVISDKKRIPEFSEDEDEKITIKEDAKPSIAEKAEETPKAKRIDVEKVLAKKNLQEIWVQLGTFKAEDEATKAWQEVREKNADIFGDVGIRVTKSENAKGSYYRLQSGPIFNEDDARDLCKKLNARQQSCFYAKTKE